MAGNAPTWNEYEVSLPGGLARHVRSLTGQPVVAEIDAGAQPAEVQLRLPIPDLSGHPTPRDKAKYLLETAAEVEHTLMVQYLYAAYSLKSSDEVTDPTQQDLLDDQLEDSWPQTLRGIAREEMGHLMTVQNLLAVLALAPNLEREDFPVPEGLYPFTLKLQPLTQSSLAKYVVAEAPGDAADIGDIIELAKEKQGSAINRVGILYALLAMIFARQDQIEPGATGDPDWDATVLAISHFAYAADPERGHWHLDDGAFHPETLEQQADPDDWNAGQLRVDRIADRADAVQAIRFIGVQGEGLAGETDASHFGRFLRIFRGVNGDGAFPPPGGWVPTRAVPENPTADQFGHERTRRWAELADARYALLLGFIGHYLVAAGERRQTLTRWIFAEMRSALRFIARELTEMPANEEPNSTERGAAPFTLRPPLALPDDEAARWRVHKDRTADAIAVIEALRGADTPDPHDAFLAGLLASDKTRLNKMTEMAEQAQPALGITGD